MSGAKSCLAIHATTKSAFGSLVAPTLTSGAELSVHPSGGFLCLFLFFLFVLYSFCILFVWLITAQMGIDSILLNVKIPVCPDVVDDKGIGLIALARVG